MSGFIPLPLYKQLLDQTVIPCVDIVARYNNQFLLIKRTNPPAKDQWWLPGGRIFKGETMQQAAERKLKEETNLTGKVIKMLGPYETIFPDAPFDIKTGVHSINVVFLMDVDNITQLTHDKDHAAHKFFSTIEKSWHPYLKQVLHDTGFS